ncbi:MAG: TonB-dependent receptor [Xanthomonadales bacterium]|nr:TonB-dependent receptor [Gammaproteobacteria bacterium]MBT8053234.1 TonB-dependent receptor [Gammaproteobacteria bacterium]NND56826.1 TonB-dependent receptor [Xanthomonadales bacterium]NNK50274.1 TonB-dependent receptor [Xanthomonadales bacterium]
MAHHFRGRTSAPVILMSVFCSAASATQESEELEMDHNRPLETVVVTATRTEESVLDVAEAVTVVGAEEINRQAPELLAEMLRGMPGAYFQQTTPGQGIPIIRGLKGSQVLHLVDGMRLNNAFFRNAPNQYLGLVDAYATDRTEVIRGAAPSLYGADAMGGVVQVLTAEPDLPGDSNSILGRFYGTYNSVDNSLIGRLEAAGGRAGSVLSGGVSYQRHGDRETGDGQTITPTDYRVKAADLKWRYDLGERSELMLSAQYLEQPSTPRIDELVAGFGQEHPSSSQYEFKPNRREFLHARYRLEGRSKWFSRFEAHLGRQTITDDRLTQDWEDPRITDESNQSRLDGLTLQFISAWGGAGGPERTLVWGLEYYQDQVSSSRVRTNTVTGETEFRRGRFPDDSSMDSGSVYASSRWKWERLSLDAGLRYSWFEIDLPASAEVQAVRLSPTDLTGDIHLNYEISPGTHLVTNIGRGFRPPNIFDLGTLGSRPGNRFNVPNPSLKPESVWSYDLGIKTSTARWQFELFAWYSDYRDKISSRLTGEFTPEGRAVVISDNLSTARLYGLESGLRFLASDAWEFYAVVNYTRGEENDGEASVPADRIPPVNGRIGAVWQPDERIRMEPYLDFSGRQDRLSPRDERDPRINPLGTAGWGTVNLLIGWKVREEIELGLRLQNLADKNYREHGSGINAPGRNIGFWLDYLF